MEQSANIETPPVSGDGSDTPTEEFKSETNNAFSGTIPKDIFSDKIPVQEIRPLDGAVDEKAYSAIPNEPTSATSDKGSGYSSTSTESPSSPATDKPTPEEIKSNAAQTADAIWDGYKMIIAGLKQLFKINEPKLTKLHLKGEIDLNEQLPLAGNQSISANDFFVKCNTTIDGVKVKPELIEKGTPPLTRLLIKHNVLMSDGMYFASLILKDMAVTGSLLAGIHLEAKSIVQSLKDTALEKKSKEGKPQAAAHDVVRDDTLNNNDTIKDTFLTPGGEWRETS